MNICRRPKLSLPSLPAGRGGRGARGGGGVCGPESRDVSLCVRLAFVVITSKASSKENFTTKLPLTKEKSCPRNLKKRGAFQLVCMSCESDCSLGAAATLIAGSAVLAILSALLLTDDPVLQRSLFPFLPLLLAGWAAAFVAVRSPASLWQQGTHTSQSHCYSTHSRSISRTFFPISPLDCAASQTLCHGNRQPLTPQVLATVTHLALFRRCSAADARYSDTILQMMAAGVDFDTEDKAVMEAALVNKVAVDSASLPLPEWPRRSSRDSEGGGGGSRRSSRSGCVPAPH